MAGQGGIQPEQALDAEAALAAATLSELRKKQNAKTWSSNMEVLLAQWGEKAAGLRFMHANTGGSWKKFANKIALSSIFVTTVGSSLSLVATSIDDQEIKDGFLFGVGAIGLLSALLQSLSKFYQAEEKAADHNSISKQFGSFYRYMTLQMGMSREDRIPADQLSEYSLKEYERLMTEAPSLSGKSIQLFKSTFKNSKQSIPDVVEDEFIINIYEPPPFVPGKKEDKVEVTEVTVKVKEESVTEESNKVEENKVVSEDS